MKIKALALFAAITVVLSGCGSDTPSTSDAKNAFQKKIEQSRYLDFKDCVDVTDFVKTNGLSAEVSGVKVYEFDYEASVKFKAVCYGNYFPESESFNALSTQKPADPPKWMTNAKPVQEHKIGDVLKVKGKLAFHKTENGWIDGNI